MPNAAINTLPPRWRRPSKKAQPTRNRRIKMDDFDRSSFDDLTQEQLLQLMQTNLDFTSAETEANREYNGRLFLSEDVVFGSVYGFEAGATFCTTTGELIEPKVTREIKELKKAVNDVFDEALDTFKNWQSDPAQREAIQSLLVHVFIRQLKIEKDLGDATAL
jgi:hypothetical protein